MFIIFMLISSPIISETSILFGLARNEIGVDRGEGEIWKPLFFDVDREGNFHIPDFYKGRVAVFNNRGELIREMLVNEGISPRMNFFSLNHNGSYTTYDNYTLYNLNNSGEIIWKQNFGLGVIPSRVYTDSRGIFISFSGSNYYMFNYSANNPVKEVEDIVLNKKTKKADDNTLLHQDDYRSIWVNNSKYRELIIDNYNNAERDIKKVPVPANNSSGSGFWVVVGKDGNIYSNIFNDEGVLFNKF